MKYLVTLNNLLVSCKSCGGADFILGGIKITADGDCSHEIKTLAPWKESYDQPRKHIKKQRNYFANKDPSSKVLWFL